jgi:hypothetical protein
MPRLNNLAHSQPANAIIALTGDCTSDLHKQLPATWNLWPQPIKLSVPGNHDQDDTFDLLGDWKHSTPWVERVEGLVFVGLDTANGFLLMQQQLDRIAARAVGGDAIVILSHRWPTLRDTWVGERWRRLAAGRPLLVLHGHEHRNFNGSLWERTARIRALTCYRSKVYSSANGRRGLAHAITWDGNQFVCDLAQGNLQND